jgi:hypothetical protein
MPGVIIHDWGRNSKAFSGQIQKRTPECMRQEQDRLFYDFADYGSLLTGDVAGWTTM